MATPYAYTPEFGGDADEGARQATAAQRPDPRGRVLWNAFDRTEGDATYIVGYSSGVACGVVTAPNPEAALDLAQVTWGAGAVVRPMFSLVFSSR
jgi:hypothetical protein